MTRKERDCIRVQLWLGKLPSVTQICKLLDDLDEAEADYERASDFIDKHLRENHGCVNCPSRTGWCESPNMKERCGRALVADRNAWRDRAEQAEAMIKSRI